MKQPRKDGFYWLKMTFSGKRAIDSDISLVEIRGAEYDDEPTVVYLMGCEIQYLWEEWTSEADTVQWEKVQGPKRLKL